MKISVPAKQNFNVFRATVRKKLFIVSVIQVFYFSKNFFTRDPLRITGAPTFNRIKSQNKAKIFGRKKPIEQMQKIQIELSVFGSKVRRFNLLMNTEGCTNHVNKSGNKIRMYKVLKKSIIQI
jgi:hypothetical protein